MNNSNGNRTARPVERAANLAHRTKLSKSARAVRAANAYDGVTVVQPTRSQLASMYGVSHSYLDRARKLSPDKRRAVLEGRVGLSRQ